MTDRKVLMTLEFSKTTFFVDIADKLIPADSANRAAILAKFARRMESTRHAMVFDKLPADFTDQDVATAFDTAAQKMVSEELAAMLADPTLATLFTQEQP